MSKLVVLSLGGGNLFKGFPFVTAHLQWDFQRMQFTGSLPPAPDLGELYCRWLLLYELLYKARSVNIRSSRPQLIDDDDDGIAIDEADVTHVSDAEFFEVCQKLQDCINSWLDCADFRPIERQLRRQLEPKDEIRLIIQTEDDQLRKLPWHAWDFFEDYPCAEVSLSSLNFEPGKPAQPRTGQVRILAVLGSSTGIDTEADRRLLKELPGAYTVFLVEPQRQELNEQLWDHKGWDLLFFAGHSWTQADGETGKICINPKESLTIPQLKYALNKAIERGLQLAIFNSCEGLGLARQLADLHIPQIIVMREPVPDRVAQEFLKHFLTVFANGQSFYLSVREAREKLQGIETQFPGASWLPVIFQNPAIAPPTWQQWRSRVNAPRSTLAFPDPQPKFPVVLLTSVIVTVLLTGVRWLGILEAWELKAFDHLLQRRPAEAAEQRLLIIGADEEDIGSSGYGYPLPDQILAQLLNKLQSHQPAAIGIDIFRDLPVPKEDVNGQQALVDHLQNDNIVAVCAGINLSQSVAPPPTISPQQVGFVDLDDDSQPTEGKDDTVRRYSLSRSPNPVSTPSRCTTPYSFAWQLAYRYLNSKGIPVETVDKDWKFGETVFKRLESRSGGYQNLDARGNQLLINYRHSPHLAQQLTVREVLDDSYPFDPAWVKDRVVLIGVTAASVPDVHDTPLGEIRGLDIHAHVVSQILSTVEDNRPLFWWLPPWGDGLWILFWSLTGGVIVLVWQRPLRRGVALSSSLSVLYGICWFVLLQGGWLPLVPSVLALVFTAAGVVVYTAFKQKPT